MENDRDAIAISLRLIDAATLEDDWRVVESIYGKNVTKKAKELAPADPCLLYDFVANDYYNNGLSKDEVVSKIFSQSEKDWENAMSRLAKEAKKAKAVKTNLDGLGY